jgi:hypothetical protein
MHRSPLFAILLTVTLFVTLLTGCAHKTIVVTIPPKYDLKQHQTIGIIDFDASATTDSTLQRDVTLIFIENLQAAQPGVSILELGNERTLLASVNATTLDPAAIKAIGSKNGVDAIFSGRLDLSPVTPDLKLSGNLDAIRAQTAINGTLTAKLRGTKNGATLWSISSHGSRTLASMDVSYRGPTATRASIGDTQQKARTLVIDLVRYVTSDFYPTYERRKVDK